MLDFPYFPDRATRHRERRARFSARNGVPESPPAPREPNPFLRLAWCLESTASFIRAAAKYDSVNSDPEYYEMLAGEVLDMMDDAIICVNELAADYRFKSIDDATRQLVVTIQTHMSPIEDSVAASFMRARGAHPEDAFWMKQFDAVHDEVSVPLRQLSIAIKAAATKSVASANAQADRQMLPPGEAIAMLKLGDMSDTKKRAVHRKLLKGMPTNAMEKRGKIIYVDLAAWRALLKVIQDHSTSKIDFSDGVAAITERKEAIKAEKNAKQRNRK